MIGNHPGMTRRDGRTTPLFWSTLGLLSLVSLSACSSPENGTGGTDGTGASGNSTTGGASSQGSGGASSVPSGTGGQTNTPGSGGTVHVDGSTIAPSSVVTESGEEITCANVVRPPTPLRRLTRFEYNNTVRDLFQTSLTPADDFPVDEVADGFSNNALVLTIAGLHAEKYTLASEAIAADVVSRLPSLLPCDPAGGEEACARQFAEEYGRRAYRRALEPQDIEVLMAAYEVGDSFEKGIEIMVRAMLQSPHFLLRIESTGANATPGTMVRLNGYETATRLSYLVWASLPDDELLDAAENGGLETPEQVEKQARRMLADPKARGAVTEFYRQWLELTRLHGINKDPEGFPLWDAAMRQAMIEEGDAVIDEVVFGDEPTLERLLTAPLGLPTGPLAQLYGVPEADSVAQVDADQRTGVMTLPGFLSVQAHPDQTSPVLRGLFVREKLLCTKVPPPPDDVDITVPDQSEGGTARERFSAHVSAPSCQKCHELMDPLGYTFETYDAMGTYRTTDMGQELDLTGEFNNTRQLDGPFDGIHQMAQTLASGAEVSDCVATQWFKYSMGRGEEDGDACSLYPLREAFEHGDANLRELLVATTQTEAFLYRKANSEVSQ